MGYLYGSRYVYDKAETDPTVLALREELYCEPYSTIEWDSTRHMVAPMDNYSPIPNVMCIAQNCLACYENWSIFQPFKKLVRNAGSSFCIDYMAAEDLQTNFIDIGPVNKVLNMLSAYNHANQDISHPTVGNHMLRVADYLWVAEDGMKMKGYNGSQCWDTSFAIQAISEAGLLDEFPVVSSKVWRYLERCQILSTELSQATPAYKYESAHYRRQYYRHLSEGGWPFSTSAHGWPISDCTGEGLKGVLCLLQCKTVQIAVKQGSLKPISVERLEKAANVLLSYQNEDGGFATYENCRGFGWYEWLNPSEVFGDIMIDYSYVECSMAALTGLVDFHECYPAYRSEDIRHAIAKGRVFLQSLQRSDGSWYGSWACCFCYACWFGVEGSIKCGEPYESASITKACSFLLQNQRANGGWGEDFTSCYDKDYASEGMKAYGDDGSGVVNTAWALLALSAARTPNVEAVKRGVRYLLDRQLPCGDWPQEGIAGVFNRACGITYTAYRNIFPIWALGRCMAVYGEALND
jgi:cycloartenol synthase